MGALINYQKKGDAMKTTETLETSEKQEIEKFLFTYRDIRLDIRALSQKILFKPFKYF